MKLDVCIIATVRPEVLKMTLQSFTKNLLNQFDCRAIINVDPVGDTARCAQMDVVHLCREYFPRVVYRTPDTPSFAGAVKWAWQQVETDWFLHLEDDWLLTKRVDAEPFVSAFQDAMVVNIIVGSRRRKKDAALVQQRIADGRLKPYSDDAKRARSFVLMPGFMRNSYFKQMADIMEQDKDPEFQYMGAPNKLITPDFPEPIFLWRTQPLLIDSGRKWRKAMRLGKNRECAVDDTWLQKKKGVVAEIEWKLKWNLAKMYWQIRFVQGKGGLIRLFRCDSSKISSTNGAPSIR